MDDSLRTFLAVWGAALSTVLAIWKLVTEYRDRPSIVVDAWLAYLPCGENDETIGPKVADKRGNWSEIRLEVRIRNVGGKSLQIVSIYVQYPFSSHQIFPEGLPCILEPRSQMQYRIQKEWLDGEEVLELGVLSATGRRHMLSSSSLAALLARCGETPTTKAKYAHRDTGELVVAFKAHDYARVNTKLD